MTKDNENSARNIKSCIVEIRNFVSLVSATMERVDVLEKGFARLQAQAASKSSSSTGDISMAENRLTGNVLSRFDETWKKMMAREDKHPINKYESLNSLVRKVDLGMMALKERKEEVVRPVLLQLRRLPVGLECGARPPIWVPARLELKGWVTWNDVRGSATGLDELNTMVLAVKTRIFVGSKMMVFLWAL